MSRIRKQQESSGRRWTQWKEPEAREALAAWRRSGLSAAAFSASRGFSEARLWYWSRRMGVEAPKKEGAVSFVPVMLGEAGRARQIEIERSGVVLRVREDLGVEQIARLVAALAGVGTAC